MSAVKMRVERLERQAGIIATDAGFAAQLSAEDAADYWAIMQRQAGRAFEVFVKTLAHDELQRLLDIHLSWLEANGISKDNLVSLDVDWHNI